VASSDWPAGSSVTPGDVFISLDRTATITQLRIDYSVMTTGALGTIPRTYYLNIPVAAQTFVTNTFNAIRTAEGGLPLTP
jgi:hypothetical protein